MEQRETQGLLLSLLEDSGVPFQNEQGLVRFRFRQQGMVWETACRCQKDQVVAYGRYPFPVEKEKALGRKVVMVGDGINDSLALSHADVGIAVSDGAELAREIADVTIAGENLYGIVKLKLLSNAMVGRIKKNYRLIVGFNAGLIALGTAGVIQPAASALLHNTSTIAISLKSMENLPETEASLPAKEREEAS